MSNTSGNKESIAKCVKCAEEGILGEQYTLNGWFVKVKPLFSLDGKNAFAKNRPSVIFSFVQKGTSGTGFDIYMDIDVFDNWADDVLDVTKTFKKTIEAEKQAGEKYPKSYCFKTGENGQKSVGFCPSVVEGAFCTVHGETVKNNKKVYANIPIDYDWLRTVCKKFKRVSAPWFDMMADKIYKNSLANYSRENYEGANDNPSAEGTDGKPSAPSGTGRPNTSASAGTGKPSPKEQPDPNLKIVEVQTLDILKGFGTNGHYWVPGADIKNKQYNFVFAKEDMQRIPKWENFKKSAVKGKMRITLKYIQVDTACYVKDIL